MDNSSELEALLLAIRCPRCAGAGRAANSYRLCPACQGTGVKSGNGMSVANEALDLTRRLEAELSGRKTASKLTRLRVAIDIGGVLSKYPEYFMTLIEMMKPMADIYFLTDMPVKAAESMLAANGIGPEHGTLLCADFATYNESCKLVLCEVYDIDVFFDDHMAYLSKGRALRLLVMPDLDRPYYAKTWRKGD